MTIKSTKYLGELDSYTIKGNKQVEDYLKCDIKNKKRTTVCPVSIYDGILGVTGVVTPGGIAFGGACGVSPTPAQPQVSKAGVANFKGVAGLPLVKGTPLMNLLTVFATQLDAVASAPIVPVPPMASTTLASMSAQLITPLVKG